MAYHTTIVFRNNVELLEQNCDNDNHYEPFWDMEGMDLDGIGSSICARIQEVAVYHIHPHMNEECSKDQTQGLQPFHNSMCIFWELTSLHMMYDI